MWKILREGSALLLKLAHDARKADLAETEETELETETVPTILSKIEPMRVYWDNDKKDLKNNNQPLIELYLESIPDKTEKPVKETHFEYENIFTDQSPLKDLIFNGVSETPKVGTGISNSGRDAGMVAGIVVAVISGVILLAAVIAGVMYRHYVHHNVTSMNFDNPVYRKTTEDQFALEKNGYAPGSKLYPSTVGEEAQEPLNKPGTEFV